MAASTQRARAVPKAIRSGEPGCASTISDSVRADRSGLHRQIQLQYGERLVGRDALLDPQPGWLADGAARLGHQRADRVEQSATGDW